MTQIQSELNISLKLATQEAEYLSRTMQALQLVTSWRTPTPVKKHIIEETPNIWLTLDPVKAVYPSEREKPNPWLSIDPVKTIHASEQEKPNPWLSIDPVKTVHPSEQEKPNPWLSIDPVKTEFSSDQEQEQEQSPEDRIITLNEVSNHDAPNDCWVIIYDRVYDITTFMDEHPGGSEIMMEYAGRDASTAFRGSGHSRSAVRSLERFLLGELPMHERIYRKPGGIRLSDIPD